MPACEARNRPGLSPEPNNNKFVNMNTYMNRANVIASYGNSTCLEKSFFWPTDGPGPNWPAPFPARARGLTVLAPMWGDSTHDPLLESTRKFLGKLDLEATDSPG